jgi:hypothetical protein
MMPENDFATKREVLRIDCGTLEQRTEQVASPARE